MRWHVGSLWDVRATRLEARATGPRCTLAPLRSVASVGATISGQSSTRATGQRRRTSRFGTASTSLAPSARLPPRGAYGEQCGAPGCCTRGGAASSSRLWTSGLDAGASSDCSPRAPFLAPRRRWHLILLNGARPTSLLVGGHRSQRISCRCEQTTTSKTGVCAACSPVHRSTHRTNGQDSSFSSSALAGPGAGGTPLSARRRTQAVGRGNRLRTPYVSKCSLLLA